MGSVDALPQTGVVEESELEKRIALLEQELKSLTAAIKSRDAPTVDENAISDGAKESSEEQNGVETEAQVADPVAEEAAQPADTPVDDDLRTDFRFKVVPVPGVKDNYQWPDFQNKYKEDDKGVVKSYAIETYFKDHPRNFKAGGAPSFPESIPPQPLAIRIQSYFLLAVLHEMGLDFSLDFDPVYMMRPYKWLANNEENLVERLRKLEAQMGDSVKALGPDQGRDHPSTSPIVQVDALKERVFAEDQSATKDGRTEEKVPQTLQEKWKSLKIMHSDWSAIWDDRNAVLSREDCLEEQRQDLKCLVEFVQKYISPKKALGQGSLTGVPVAYPDLWYIYKPGVDICTEAYRDQAGTAEPISLNRQKRLDQTVWRILGTAGGHWKPVDASKSGGARVVQLGQYLPFWIRAYSIDFNGSVYGAVCHDFAIEPFQGLKELSSLELFPLDSLKNGASIRGDLMLTAPRLEEYRKTFRFKHRYYEGRAFVVRNDDDGTCDQEDIDSPVIIDIPMALQENPHWAQQMGIVDFVPPIPSDVDVYWPENQNRFKFLEGNSGRRGNNKELDEVTCFTVGNEDNAEGADGRGLRPESFDVRESTEDFVHLKQGDHVLLPSRVFAYVLRARKFALVELKNLSELPEDKISFNNLVIRAEYKHTVQALVTNHFRRKELRRNDESNGDQASSHDVYDNDIIRGKGRGLMILLHGPPGVGKTSTAECVAAKFGKPLLPITCADLGTNAQSVEAALDRIFNYAYRWDCILLLDEADVFLTIRKPSDIERNSLVTVFLRVLEYYRGILFLTTNRVGNFDDAFKSRMHVILHYPPLTETQSDKIWDMNLKRATWNALRPHRDPNAHTRLIECEPSEEAGILQMAKEHFLKSRASGSMWNARQIRNAFRTAIALAEFQHRVGVAEQSKEATASTQPKLQRKHFEQVMRMASEFDDYLKQTRNNQTESDVAQKRGDRVDEYSNPTYGIGGGSTPQRLRARQQPPRAHASSINQTGFPPPLPSSSPNPGLGARSPSPHYLSQGAPVSGTMIPTPYMHEEQQYQYGSYRPSHQYQNFPGGQFNQESQYGTPVREEDHSYDDFESR